VTATSHRSDEVSNSTVAFSSFHYARLKQAHNVRFQVRYEPAEGASHVESRCGESRCTSRLSLN
jgi:hypothetical protein